MRHACASDDSLSLQGANEGGCSAVGVSFSVSGGEYTGTLFFAPLVLLAVVVVFVVGFCSTVMCLSAVVLVVLSSTVLLAALIFLLGGI